MSAWNLHYLYDISLYQQFLFLFITGKWVAHKTSKVSQYAWREASETTTTEGKLVKSIQQAPSFKQKNKPSMNKFQFVGSDGSQIRILNSIIILGVNTC